jgi:hypothetical protein
MPVRQRWQAMVRRHHLGGGAPTPDAVTYALVALHATDPAPVYLPVLARASTSTLADVSAAMYERRTLVRWMAMRRTLFLLTRADERPGSYRPRHPNRPLGQPPPPLGAH